MSIYVAHHTHATPSALSERNLATGWRLTTQRVPPFPDLMLPFVFPNYTSFHRNGLTAALKQHISSRASAKKDICFKLNDAIRCRKNGRSHMNLLLLLYCSLNNDPHIWVLVFCFF